MLERPSRVVKPGSRRAVKQPAQTPLEVSCLRMLDDEPDALKLRDQAPPPEHVDVRAVFGVAWVKAPEDQFGLGGRNGDASPPSGPQRACDFAHPAPVVGHVLEHLGADHAVEGAVFGKSTLDVQVLRRDRDPSRRRLLRGHVKERRIGVGPHDLEPTLS
jgi:hypothetical protein